MAVGDTFPIADVRAKLDGLDEAQSLAVCLAAIERMMPTGELALSTSHYARLRSLVDHLWQQCGVSVGQGAGGSESTPEGAASEPVSEPVSGSGFVADALSAATSYVCRAWICGDEADYVLALAQGFDWAEELATRHAQHSRGHVTAEDVAESDILASEIDAIETDIQSVGADGAVRIRERALECGLARRVIVLEVTVSQ